MMIAEAVKTFTLCSVIHDSVPLTLSRRLLDNNVIHHKWVGRVILFFTLLHIIAHCFNLEHLCQAFDSDDEKILAISRYPDNFQVDEADNYVNPIRASSTSPYEGWGLGHCNGAHLLYFGY